MSAGLEGVTTAPALGGDGGGSPTPAGQSGTETQPGSHVATPGVTGGEDGGGRGAQERIRQLVQQRNEETAARQALEQRLQDLSQKYGTLEERLQGASGLHERLREAIAPTPKTPELPPDPLEQDVASLKETARELKEFRDSQIREQRNAVLKGALERATEKHSISEDGIKAVIADLRALKGSSVQDLVKAIPDLVKAVHEREESRWNARAAKAKEPPKSLVDVNAPLLPSANPPKTIGEARKQALALLR